MRLSKDFFFCKSLPLVFFDWVFFLKVGFFFSGEARPFVHSMYGIYVCTCEAILSSRGRFLALSGS